MHFPAPLQQSHIHTPQLLYYYCVLLLLYYTTPLPLVRAKLLTAITTLLSLSHMGTMACSFTRLTAPVSENGRRLLTPSITATTKRLAFRSRHKFLSISTPVQFLSRSLSLSIYLCLYLLLVVLVVFLLYVRRSEIQTVHSCVCFSIIRSGAEIPAICQVLLRGGGGGGGGHERLQREAGGPPGDMRDTDASGRYDS